MEQLSYTKTEFAELVGVKRASVHRWIKNGSVKTINIPGGWSRIPESEVKRFKGE